LRLAIRPIPRGASVVRHPDPDGARQVATVRALLRLGAGTLPARGLHSSTFKLNLSAFRVIRGAFRGHLEGGY